MARFFSSNVRIIGDSVAKTVLSLRSQQRVVATVEESVHKTEMAGLESQEEDAPNRILFFNPMS